MPVNGLACVVEEVSVRRDGSLCWSSHCSARSSRAKRGVRRAGRRVLERATRDQARYPGLSRISMHCVNGRRLGCHAAAAAAAPSCARHGLAPSRREHAVGAGGRRRQHGSAAAPTKSTSAKHERQARAPSTSAKDERPARRRGAPSARPGASALESGHRVLDFGLVLFDFIARRTAQQGRTRAGVRTLACSNTP